VRDALDLSVDRGRGVPPRLLEDAPERSGLLDADSRHRAALEWPSWWVDAVGWRGGVVRDDGTHQHHNVEDN